jgi:hypothetical protein
VVLVLSVSLRVGSAETVLPLQKFSYHEDFEQQDPVEFSASNGKYKVNFKGLTSERSYSGKKSFKLDVSFESGGYFYWGVRFKRAVPAEGRLGFSGRIFVARESTGGAGFGVNLALPPTSHLGCAPRLGYGKQGEWTLITSDLAEEAKRTARGVCGKMGLSEADEGRYLNGWYVALTNACPGARVVVYIDDLRVEGEVPAEAEYKKEIERRWALAGKKIQRTVTSWKSAIPRIEMELAALGALSEEARVQVEASRERVARVRAFIAQAEKGGPIGLWETVETVLPSPDRLEAMAGSFPAMLGNFRGIQQGKIKTGDVVIHVVPPISGLKRLPADGLVFGAMSDTLSVVACPGEYEPASFVVSALRDIASLKVEASDLSGASGVIPCASIDISVVKCWYQAASAWKDVFLFGPAAHERHLVPELLLKDDSLVKVDHAKKENYLKLSYPGGRTEYVCTSNRDPKPDLFAPPVEEFPVRDSPALLPVNIGKGTGKQFWITVRVPDGSRSGVYAGKITLSTSEGLIRELELTLRVLPFKLSPCPVIQCLCYRGTLDPAGRGTVSSELKSETQLRREMQNMFAHGVTNPTCYQRGLTAEGLGRYLKIREEVGMSKDALYYLGADINSSPSTIRDVVAFAKSYGIREVYFWGVEEWPSAKELLSARAACQRVHAAGGKVFGGGSKIYFEPLGDLLDFFTLGGPPDKAEAARWHSVGHKITCYCNPQVGAENPELYRRNYGLLLWLNDYDGDQNYAYQHSFGNIWNDFDFSTVRDHVFAYPTVDGVIDTIAWEGHREAVDDLRYLATLLKAIEQAKASRAKAQLATEAESWVRAMDVGGNLDALRAKIVDWILRLSE